MYKQEKPEANSNLEEELLDKAGVLMRAGHKFVVQRNEHNIETAEVKPGKLQGDWRIMNVDRKNKIVNMYRGTGAPEVFHVPIQKLFELNPEVFNVVVNEPEDK